MANFGIPYMGSKSKICKDIAFYFPNAKNFYDLFGGGFAVTHYMMTKESDRYETFHFNEIKSGVVDLIKRAIAGEFNYEVFKPAWITREDFFASDDAYVKVCWSFGNNQKDYMFGPEIERYKKSMHQAVVFNDFDDLAELTLRFKSWPKELTTIKQKRLYLRQKIEHYRVTKIPEDLHKFLSKKQLQQLERLQQLEQLERLQQLQQLERLQQLQQLERLEKLQQLERLRITALDYRNVKILKDSVVYCDIPYFKTGDYQNNFNHQEFFDWAATRDFPVYVSEYNIDDPRFKLVFEIEKRSMLSPTGYGGQKIERLYWNQVGQVRKDWFEDFSL